MNADASTIASAVPSREQLLHMLYEAAELEHTLMCTYLYAAFSLKTAEHEGLSTDEASATTRWRRTIIDIAVGEMDHLVAVWNITCALGGMPRLGRGNFPLDVGQLPAGIVVKLAPFNPATLQHFVFLERPAGSDEPEGEGFAAEWNFVRGIARARLTPTSLDYDTVGAFYAQLADGLRRFALCHGESAAFCGDPGLQLSPAEIDLPGARRVICLTSALCAFDAIVAQGEGASLGSAHSHFSLFTGIRTEYVRLLDANPRFVPAFPAAHNPVLRRPPKPQGRVWIEDEEAVRTVDLANAAYGLMMRLLAHVYSLSGPSPEKALTVDLAVALMRAVTPLGERAARLPAGPSNPDCHAGVSFTALRNPAPIPRGDSAHRFFIERFDELREAAQALAAGGDARAASAARLLTDLATRAARDFARVPATTGASAAAAPPAAQPAAAQSTSMDGVDFIEGKDLTLIYAGKLCIHSRFCVTGAPRVFLANVEGPWIHPDAMEVDDLTAIARECPSGAIRYRRKDGRPDETAPPVNLIGIREAGPYAVRAQITIDGRSAGYRATLCRCGASKNKPFCDGSHHAIAFAATGEPASGKTDMLEARDGVLAIDPQTDGPLQVRGNLEITSGTGRVVARVQSTRLCRCGASNNKPFCDNSHARIGFRSGPA
ncbi:MAG: ferritin-like domain-containing protein [Dokdonella sp.]